MRNVDRTAAVQTIRCLAAALCLLASAHRPACAQLVLPGAVAPSSETAPAAAPRRLSRPAAARPAGGEPAPPPPAAVPNPAALGGRTLALNGGATQVTFSLADKQLSVSRLVLEGEMLSNARAPCRVQADPTPIALTSLGRPLGVERIQLSYAACPLVFDVLEGAVLVDATQGACEFKAADCHVEPAGLWGPMPADLGPDKDKAIEKARGRAEAAVRSNYKGLTASTKDRPTIMSYAHEQAQFSSTREEICRTYVGEGRHGYCATKLTEARAAQLRQELGVALVAKAERKAKRDKARAAAKR